MASDCAAASRSEEKAGPVKTAAYAAWLGLFILAPLFGLLSLAFPRHPSLDGLVVVSGEAFGYYQYRGRRSDQSEARFSLRVGTVGCGFSIPRDVDEAGVVQRAI